MMVCAGQHACSSACLPACPFGHPSARVPTVSNEPNEQFFGNIVPGYVVTKLSRDNFVTFQNAQGIPRDPHGRRHSWRRRGGRGRGHGRVCGRGGWQSLCKILEFGRGQCRFSWSKSVFVVEIGARGRGCGRVRGRGRRPKVAYDTRTIAYKT